ncbi:SLAM family member 6-like [Orycteropus afer afer]|uniref:SLAM family member 6-like n=1 Tax=Orycteropus afer afer TaxID=1230840 RepID=A0A8B6ZJX5_ORYAF|nr:SLAM family member 6-like [Orycteropus afer afer]
MELPIQLLFLLLLLSWAENTASQSSSNTLTVNGLLGELVTFPLKFPVGEEIEYITWLHNGKSVAFIHRSETGSLPIIVIDSKRKERLNFTPSYSLQLSNLMMEDAGSYNARIISKTSIRGYFYTLRVFEQLPRHRVAMDSIICENGTHNITLRHFVEEGGADVTYRWIRMGPGAVVSQGEAILSNLDQTYTCTVMNAVSNNNCGYFLSEKLCAGSKAAEGTYCPVTWILLGKTLLFLVLLGILGIRHIFAQQTS